MTPSNGTGSENPLNINAGCLVAVVRIPVTDEENRMPTPFLDSSAAIAQMIDWLPSVPAAMSGGAALLRAVERHFFQNPRARLPQRFSLANSMGIFAAMLILEASPARMPELMGSMSASMNSPSVRRRFRPPRNRAPPMNTGAI